LCSDQEFFELVERADPAMLMVIARSDSRSGVLFQAQVNTSFSFGTISR
jgi:hypothetical protein